jgi:hypothetical protein
MWGAAVVMPVAPRFFAKMSRSPFLNLQIFADLNFQIFAELRVTAQKTGAPV